ncbi:MAG: replication initiator protein A [Lachnospiraceae bacterium]|nr:replication initiator protein A [Lachnospiraceae bacterium]
MGDGLRFDYYYGIEAEQFSFYRVPRLLIKDERFKELSSDAKLLYGLMLDRMALSMKNGWIDEENRAYIHYTLDNIMEDLGCAREKCSKVIAELDSKKGIGLIEKKRQGLGKPDIIYVKNFATLEARTEEEKHPESPANTDVSTEVRKPNFKEFDNQTSRNSEIELQEIRKSNFKKFDNQTSRGSETELAEVREPNGNYNNNNYTELSYTNPINLSVQGQNMQAAQAGDTMDGMDEVSAYIELIKQNIEYEQLMAHGEWQDKALYEELFEVICEVVCVKRKTVRVGGEDYPYELVKSKFLKLDSTHLQYVIGCMQNTTTKIANIKAYMITSLYNAPNTINHYYQQEVQHDMYGGGWHEKGIV